MRLSEGDVLHQLVLVLRVCTGALNEGHGQGSSLAQQILIAAQDTRVP